MKSTLVILILNRFMSLLGVFRPIKKFLGPLFPSTLFSSAFKDAAPRTQRKRTVRILYPLFLLEVFQKKNYFFLRGKTA